MYGEMKMKLIKRCTAFFLLAAIVFSCAACGSKSSNATIYFELTEKPQNIDPQIASSDSELIIVRNLFEGLLRKDGQGNIKPGACEAYEKKGLTYTFQLKKGLKWSDGTALTANDFAYGIKRAVAKETGSPYAVRLFAIKNARSVNSGSADVSALGVSAGAETVKIELEYEDPAFEEALTTSVAMPCNEKYFIKTEGLYGKNAKNILCNGSYDIFKWNTETFGIKLYKNENYKGDFPAKNGGVYFSCVEETAQSERLASNASDMAFVPSSETEDVKNAGMKFSTVENICWFLTLGDCYDSDAKAALKAAFSSEVYKENLQGGFRAADSIYPAVLNAGETNGAGMPVYDIDLATAHFNRALSRTEDKKFENSTLYYYGTDGAKDIITAVIGHWQKNLSAFVNIKESSSIEALQSELKTRSLQFAFFPVTAHGMSLSEYLANFGVSGGAQEAQQALLAADNIIPVAFQSTQIAYNPELSGVFADDGNGYIDFAFILKKE